MVKSYTYDAYGNTTAAGTFINDFAYTGAVNDPETGLYYMNARYYDPETGRFISQDTYRGTGEAFWHEYLYCNSDPVNNIDPTGHFALILLAPALLFAAGVLLAVAMTAYVIYLGVKLYKNSKKSNITKAKSKSEVDPFARPGQKKMARESKEKKKLSDKWKSNPNKKPQRPKKHTPADDHRKFKK
ncbi:MAG: RHS repeat-associated core domain-containing protein [Eubacteriaceae bacterium]